MEADSGNYLRMNMKPVVIFRHALTEGAGYFGTFLNQQQIPWKMIRIDQGESLPDSIQDYSGVVLMGGPMSVNDDLPWIPPLLTLIHEAIDLDIPLLGHCLGGQLISKALGATVSSNSVKEIGWGEVSVHASNEARRWFGELTSFNSFHWHGETFSLPLATTHLLSSEHCRNQAYTFGKHLAFQCHIEMTVDMVKTWCAAGAEELAQAASSPGVQQAAEIQRDLYTRIAGLNSVAESVYTQWIKGLMR
jgi:GMP synthase-like glutamine amidotransferase